MLQRRALRPLRGDVPRPLGPAGGAEGAAPKQAAQAEQRPSNLKKGGTHAYTPDPRNADIMIGMRDGVTGATQGNSCYAVDTAQRLPCVALGLSSWPAAAAAAVRCTWGLASQLTLRSPLCLPMGAPPPAGDFSLVWRPEAKVSVLDSGFMLGDGVWEGIRLHRGVLLFAQVGVCLPVRRPPAPGQALVVNRGDQLRAVFSLGCLPQNLCTRLSQQACSKTVCCIPPAGAHGPPV